MASTPRERPSVMAEGAPSKEAQPSETGTLLSSCSLFSAWLAGNSFLGLIHLGFLRAATVAGAITGDPMEVDPTQLLPPVAGTIFFIVLPLCLSTTKV
jgi:hypothetical protein